MKVQVKVGCPVKMVSSRLSDHGPISCDFGGSSASNVDQPIPPWVAKLPVFKQFLGALVQASKLHNLLPSHALLEYKRLTREAARIARNQHYDSFRDTPQQKLPNLVLISRLVASNNVKMARALSLSHGFSSPEFA